MSFFNSHSNFKPCLRPKGDSLLPLERTLDRALCGHGTVQPKPKRLPWHSDFTTQLSTALNLLETKHQGDESNWHTGGELAHVFFVVRFFSTIYHCPFAIQTRSVRFARSMCTCMLWMGVGMHIHPHKLHRDSLPDLSVSNL